MKKLLIAIVLLTLTGCATTRIGQYDNDWYVVGTNNDVEVQANQVSGKLDIWYVRIVNLSELDYDVLVGWRTMDYTNFVFQGWVRVPAGQFRNIGHFEQQLWELNGEKLNLEDGMIKVDSIEIEEVKE